VTPIRKGTSKRLGIARSKPVVEPYALIALAFPAPEGATAWRCLYGNCSARGYYLLSRASAETAAVEHVRRDHPSHLKGPVHTVHQETADRAGPRTFARTAHTQTGRATAQEPS